MTIIDRLLTLSSKLSSSSSSSSSTSSSENAKNLTLKQLIQVNESLIDSIILYNNNNTNTNTNSVETKKDYDQNKVINTNLTFVDVEDILHCQRSNSDDGDDGDSDSKLNNSNHHKRKIVIQKLLKRIFTHDNEKNNHEEEEIMTICESILLLIPKQQSSDDDVVQEEEEEERILMVFQYLLRLSTLSKTSSSSSSLQLILHNILNLTYPLLLSTSTSFSTALRDAILDASFLLIIEEDTKNNTRSSSNHKKNQNDNDNNNDDVHNLLSTCLYMIQQSIETMLQITIFDSRKYDSFISSEWIITVVEFSSRLLSRILSLVKGDDGSNSDDRIESILDTIHQVSLSILTSLCYYSSSSNNNGGGPLLMNGKTSTLLKIVTSLLLPSLIELSNNTSSINQEKFQNRMLVLWNFIHDLMLNDCDNRGGGMDVTIRKKCRTW